MNDGVWQATHSIHKFLSFQSLQYI